MPADWMFVTERGASQPVVGTYNGAFSRTVISAPFGTNLGSDDIQECAQFNNVLKIGDGTQQFCVLFDGLYESTDSGATFAQVFAFTSPTADLTRRINHGGLHIAYDEANQERVLGGWFFSSIGFTITGWSYNLSTLATSETNQAYNGSSDEIIGSEILYGSSVHFNIGNGLNQSNFFSFDIVNQSWADYTLPAILGSVAGASNCYAVASDGALYLAILHLVTGVGTYSLLKFTGSWSSLGTIVSFNDTNLENNRDQARIALYSDGTDLGTYLLAGVTPSYGWQKYQITAASGFDPTVATNRTSTDVPANLRNTVDGGTANSNPDKRCIVVQDTQSTPGTLETYLAFSDDAAPGTPFSVHQDSGFGAVATFVGSGGQVRDALPQASRNGGGYFFASGQNGAEVLFVSETTGGELLHFVAYGGGTVTVQFRRGPKQQGATNLCTLFGSATGGGTRVGNTVTGVTADGVTVNTVPWDFFTDSFANNEALAVLLAETA
jgi:hypothetical protein